ncbi:hypothetical protein [Faecalicoccus pleomorphus]|uniref:hypothetical protein n=1 Tax=Faecalicoccus pleomorphus TaxID=1323 RepID=UPI00242FDE2A|nr:hypothetical protein [Faecalicoccus pleomorphus]
MNEGWKRFRGTDEEVMWHIQVLKRTSRLCAAKVKELSAWRRPMTTCPPWTTRRSWTC